MSVVDETKGFVIGTLAGVPFAHFTRLWVDCTQPDMTVKKYDVLAEETPYALIGPATIYFGINYIQCRNEGNGDGFLFIRLKDDMGITRYYIERHVPLDGFCPNDAFYLDMPERSYGITVEIGHLTVAGAQVVDETFGITFPGALVVDLPLIGGIALAITDAALILYYLATVVR